MSKPEFLSVSFVSPRGIPGKSPTQLSSGNSSPIYSPNQSSEHEATEENKARLECFKNNSQNDFFFPSASLFLYLYSYLEEVFSRNL